MSVYKEGFKIVELIENNSKQIFNDACDFGALTNKDDKIWGAANQLSKWYGEEETKKVVKYSTGLTATIEISLIDEWTTGEEHRFFVNLY